MKLTALVFIGCLIGCVSAPPAEPNNVCSIFAEKDDWYKPAKKAEKRWGTTVATAMAFTHRESSYIADAKPPRGKVMWIIPWRRPSSAYGYAQATDDTWEDYKSETRHWFVGRDDFSDAMDFIGWYNQRSHKQLGISKRDPYHLYLAYHEGLSGYRSGRWKNNAKLKQQAKKVERLSVSYQRQLSGCEGKLSSGWWPFS